VLTEKDQGYQHAVASKTPAAATTAAVWAHNEKKSGLLFWS
jgi:hypothetical protein